MPIYNFLYLQQNYLQIISINLAQSPNGTLRVSRIASRVIPRTAVSRSGEGDPITTASQNIIVNDVTAEQNRPIPDPDPSAPNVPRL
jgi:hypothetical protein